MINVYIIGSKGIPAKYGGFETFVEELTKGKVSEQIKYHVSCMNEDEKHFEYNDADCFNIKVPIRGSAGRILHVSRALKHVEKTLDKENTNIVYVLGCRIGFLMRKHYTRLHKLGVKVFVNPDGLEWKRDKWNYLEKKILKFCERCLVLNSDLAICDSENIKKYIVEEYKNKVKDTTYIAYGSYLEKSSCSEDKYDKWLESNSISKNGYYLTVGRFVPENNLEIIIREFMKTKTNRDLVIITNVEQNKFYNSLVNNTGFVSDPRVKFVGAVYDQPLLKKIREEASCYIHGHEVGGTNPSLLEALSSTKVNALLGVPFNKEVALDSALYWNKDEMSLANLISKIDNLTEDEIKDLGEKAKKEIENRYSWNKICNEYESLFLGTGL